MHENIQAYLFIKYKLTNIVFQVMSCNIFRYCNRTVWECYKLSKNRCFVLILLLRILYILVIFAQKLPGLVQHEKIIRKIGTHVVMRKLHSHASSVTTMEKYDVIMPLCLYLNYFWQNSGKQQRCSNGRNIITSKDVYFALKMHLSDTGKLVSETTERRRYLCPQQPQQNPAVLGNTHVISSQEDSRHGLIWES